MKRILITGALGLVGSTATKYFLDQGHSVIGVDNDMRKHFFGEEGSVAANMPTHGHYLHIGLDVSKIEHVFQEHEPDAIIHCAGQPSHDYAAKEPIVDFQANAIGTLLLLEMTRKYVPQSPFIFTSTNKVYGDRPNAQSFQELDTRYELPGVIGFNENLAIDQCTHSLFGCSKLAADIYVQEYGKYFGMKTVCFRLGCITGRNQAGVEQHGFLSYLVKCKKEKKRYKIYGYKGKQVRDNIHAYDLAVAFGHYIAKPRAGEVYNMGGSRANNISVLEAIRKVGIKDYDYVDEPRKGDHQWYISDVSKFQRDYPFWRYTYNMDKIFEDLMA